MRSPLESTPRLPVCCRSRTLEFLMIVILTVPAPAALRQSSAQGAVSERREGAQLCRTAVPLVAGDVRTIGVSRTEALRIKLEDGQFLHVEFDQRNETERPGVDVKISVYGPDGTPLIKGRDRLDYRNGRESISFVTQAAGDYCFVVESVDNREGTYRVRFNAPRKVEPGDEPAITLERRFLQAWEVSVTAEVYGSVPSETLQKSTAIFEEVLKNRSSLLNPEFSFIAVDRLLFNYMQAGRLADAAALIEREPVPSETEASAGTRSQIEFRRGQLLLLNRDYTKANAVFARAVSASKQAGRLEHYNLLRTIGTLYYKQSLPQMTLQYYEQMLGMLDTKRTDFNSRETLADVYNGIGACHWAMGNADRAIEYYDKALHVEDIEPHTANYPVSLNNLAVAHFQLEHYDIALGYTERQLKFCSERGPEGQAPREPEGVVRALLTKGLINTQLGNYDEADSIYQEALKAAEKIASQNEGLGRTLKGFIYHNRGLNEGEQSLHQSAIQFLEEALKNRQGRERREEAQTRINLGRILTQSGTPQKAIDEQFKPAEALLILGGFQMDLAVLRAFRGQALAAEGHHKEADKEFEAAVQTLRQLGNRHYEAIAHTLWGASRLARRDLDGAQRETLEAVRLVEELRAGLSGRELVARYLAARQKSFDLAIKVGIARYHERSDRSALQMAFELQEHSRARTLLDMLAEVYARNVFGMAQDETFRKLDDERRALVARLAEGQRPDRDELLERRARLDVAIQQLYDQKFSARPQYKKFASPATLGEIQAALPDDTIVLEYRVMDDESFLWAVTRRGLDVFPLPRRAAIKTVSDRLSQDVKAIGNAFLTPTERIKRQTDYPAAAAAATDTLLAPATALLSGKSRLIIVADGTLQTLPFAALADPKSPDRPIIDGYELVSLASATTLVRLDEMASSRPRPAKRLAIFSYKAGHSALSTSSTRAIVDDSCATRDRLVLPELRYADDEVNRVKKLFPGSHFEASGPKANRQALLDMSLRDYGIIHIVAHGYFDYRRPACSGIFLSPLNEKGSEVSANGVMSMTDFYDVTLSADLVTLSACDTAVGEMLPGEGSVGLTRGLLYAGALRVMSSRWAIIDKKAPAFMESFYRKMLTGRLSVAGALAATQREMWRNNVPPYYWAGFMLEGLW